MCGKLPGAGRRSRIVGETCGRAERKFVGL